MNTEFTHFTSKSVISQEQLESFEFAFRLFTRGIRLCGQQPSMERTKTKNLTRTRK